MDHISRVGVFVAVVEAGGFAGAARALGITSSAVSKQVQNLEQDLKVKLLNRTTRSVTVTEEGALYYDRAARALQDLREAEELALELKSRPKGPLRVSLPQSFGIKYLSAPIADFAARYPEVELDVSLNERFVDLAGEGVDLAVRIGALADTSLIARRMAGCPFVLCASADYLARHGTPDRPEDLADHNVLAFTGNSALHEWRYIDAAGRAGQISLRAGFRTDSGDMLCSAALRGVGIVILPVFYVADHLETGALRPILTGYATAPQRDIFAVFPPSRFQSTRLRLLVEHLVATCRDLPWER
ncbi:DNA-binding transcriptional regulator, LysR family [Roseovarius nanhaiticus]|uniref:DNA-binding transcriptional regulator, LysR family n=1 Tax=Roseovarius nanhaiticus TaxID=573024 RepID=A0A1N7FSH5_9RHOB|nr:LysR family transcriptional regulator [Roseovarius nanhaiticus]SEK46808.1 DNA-binding transcriptional regulator, LysR family [Roseovarius nanhaiticus]SIS03216.1 DNA-binding transcriptional regulator, LysR family [Roseovarius nanhaiticus]